eukprot:CAMPEP_0172870252 /NCGR_PEP_ID=MMETSP1075-20121228/91345_1 /TAXON_ID=2916 /ORGANISM="Ceratium fusus, Strain PA161109" /LENGTH=119 /DNA_ID=CAMNT_0013720371 /DNA_START=71 /DNA_END=432 /DNA_ORIENTATION=+
MGLEVTKVVVLLQSLTPRIRGELVSFAALSCRRAMCSVSPEAVNSGADESLGLQPFLPVKTCVSAPPAKTYARARLPSLTASSAPPPDLELAADAKQGDPDKLDLLAGRRLQRPQINSG